MSIALIADSHLGDPRGSAERFLEQLRELPARGCRRLILLGDIFHVWVGYRKFETTEVRRVAAALRELRHQGLRIDYIEGNRDFFLAGSQYAKLFDSVGLEVSFEVDGVRYLAVHGDGLDDRDWQYRFWRWLSKSPPVHLLVALLPGPLARWIMLATERRLARTNFKHRQGVPEDSLIRYAGQRFREGHDILYLGHFHEPHTWHLKAGEVRVLDAWFHDNQIEWLDEKG